MTDELNYREVGNYNLLNPMLTPIGAVDAQKLSNQIDAIVAQGHLLLGVDLGGIDFLYSDALNVLAKKSNELASKQGKIVLLTSEENIKASIAQVGLTEQIPIFSAETDLILDSMSAMDLSSQKETSEIPALDASEELIDAEDISLQMPELADMKESSSLGFFLLILAVVAIACALWYFLG